MNVLVLGAGNSFRGDDAAGILAARKLRALVPRGVAVIEREGELAGAVEAFLGQDAVFVIDAVQSGAQPGSIVRLEAHARPVPVCFSRSSTHAFGIAEAVELARALGTLPPQVVVYGIEGKSFAAGAGLSIEIAPAVDEVVERVLGEIAAHA